MRSAHGDSLHYLPIHEAMNIPSPKIVCFRLSLALIWTLGHACFESTASAQEVDYKRDIRPLFAEKCIACHGAVRQEADLRLDHGELIREGSYSGSVIDAPDETTPGLLLQRVSEKDPSMRMPPEDEGLPLNAEQMRLLSEWIKAGAPSPEDEPMPVGPDKHWAWQVPQQVEPPQVASTFGSGVEASNPIDAFIFARLQQQELKPLPAADPRTRLRRLYFDLIGLPPTPRRQREFESDPSPAAWARHVDRLLEDPAHGERWARHWMDVWRYSDWDGYKDQVRGSQRHIWRWRDWIIESLNSDKGYDQMVLEMLAGDEFAPEDPDTLRATGFLVRNYHHSNRNIWLDATVEHTSKAFLAMTLNCARCHDHKYDPIPQRDYYAFRAIFEPHQVRIERLPGEPDLTQDGLPRAYDAEPDAPTYLFVAGNEKLPDKEHPVEPSTPDAIDVPFQVSSVRLPSRAAFPALRDFVEQEDTAEAQKKLTEARAALNQALQQQQAERAVAVARQKVRACKAGLKSLQARFAADRYRYQTSEAKPCEEHYETLKQAALKAERRARVEDAKWVVLTKQQVVQEAEQALSETETRNKNTKTAKEDDSKASQEARESLEKARKDLKAAREALEQAQKPIGDDADYTSVGKDYPRTSTGRRLALARWITDRRNPLSARVAINYIWMHHFGDPLVENVFDFGLRSPAPPHVDLLDWLAVELMQNDWSMKHIHRLITTSQAYQRASSGQEAIARENRQRDPENKFFWRANICRLDAEAVRDSVLEVAGKLDRTQGGPDIDYQQGDSVYRRSIYFRHAYEKQMTMLVTFDAAAPTECYRRSTSIVPQQALALSNSPLTIDQARALASRLSAQCDSGKRTAPSKSDAKFIREAFEVLLGRVCSDEEQRVCTAFLQQQAALFGDPETLELLPGKDSGQTSPSENARQRARENLIHTLMNHNDFVTVR